MVHLMKNTEQEFLCVNCGSDQVSIVRESADPRLKCANCNFMFNGSDSKAASEKGEIPDGPPELQERSSNEESSRVDRARTASKEEEKRDSVQENPIPRSPSYVFISKARDKTEFATKKSFKKVAMRWQYLEISHDVFALEIKKVSADVTVV